MIGAWDTPYGRGRLVTRLLARDTIANLMTAGALAGNGSRVALGASLFGTAGFGASQNVVVSAGALLAPLWGFGLSLARPSHVVTLEEIGDGITSPVFVASATTTQGVVLWEVLFLPEGLQ